MSARTAQRFHCTLASNVAAACDYEAVRDRVIEAVVRAHREADPCCTVDCRVYAGVGKILVSGEACCHGEVDVEEAARGALRAHARAARFAEPPVCEGYVPEYVI